MEALLLELFMIQSRTMVNTFKELEPFLNIDEQSGFFCYRIIITLKTLFVLHAMDTAIPKTWSLASIIIGKFYVAYMNPIMTHVAFIGFILHALGLFTPQMTMMGVISMDYKSYEFLLDIYVLLCSLYYAVQACKGEIKNLTIVLFMGISIGSCVNDVTPLPFSLYTYCLIIVFYIFTIFTLMPNRPGNSHRLIYFCVVMYLLIFFKMGQHYDKSQSSASQTRNSSDVCMMLQNNFKAEHCGLIEALENQEETDFSKSLNMSDCVGYDTRKPLDVQKKNFRKKTVFKNITDVKHERTEGEYKMYPNATCASVNIKPYGRAYIQKEVIDDETPAKKELIETAKREDKELELIDKNEKHVLNFGTEERNDILQDYAELRQEPFIQDFIQKNEDPIKHEKRLSGNLKLTETKGDTYSNNDQWNRSDKCLVIESSVEDVIYIKKRLGNLKTSKGDQLSTGTDQENLVCKIRENNSVNFNEESINYSSFISIQERGLKENKNGLEATDDCDAAGIAPEEFVAQDNDAGNAKSENVHSAHHSEIQATKAEAFLSERDVFDVNESEVILTNALINDYSTEADERVTQPPLNVAVGAENTKPTTILPGELEAEPEAFEANKGAVIEASESEAFLSEALADNPIGADDHGAKELEITKASDLGMRKLEPTTAKHPGVNERKPSKVGNIKSIQTQEIKSRKPEADETEQFEPKKGKAIYVREAEVILPTTLFTDHQSETAVDVTQAGKHEIPVSQETEAGDTGATRASEFQVPKSSNANTIEPQASEVGNGKIETTAAHVNEARASEKVEAGTTEAGEVEAQLKTIQAREADPSKVSALGPCEFEPTNATDPSGTQLQSTNTNKASTTVHQRSDSADTEGNQPQATEADDRAATKACETATTEAEKDEPAKISDLGESDNESIKTSSHGATKQEATKTGKGQKKETKAYAAHKCKASDAIEAKAFSADHQSKTGEREAAASQASNAGETEATEIQATKPNETNAIDLQSWDIANIRISDPKATQAKSAKANETGGAGTIKSGEIEATDHKTSKDRAATPANASDPRPITLESFETNHPDTSVSIATQAIEANTTKSQAARSKETEKRETGTAEVGETEDNEPKATQSRKSEPEKPSNPGEIELQTTDSKETGANVPQGSEAGGTGGTELQSAQSDEGGAIEASKAEPAKFSDPGSSELEPTKIGEAGKEETEIYEAHKHKAIDASESETILSKALYEDHQSKAGQRGTTTSQATDTGDTGATELQATKPNRRNAIECQASEVGNIGGTKPKVAEANEATESGTGETGTIEAGEVEATDHKTGQDREAEPANAIDPTPFKLEHTDTNDPHTSESLATQAIKANTTKSQAAQAKRAEESETGTDEVGKDEANDPKETQSRKAEPLKCSYPGATEFQATNSKETGASVPQGSEAGGTGATEVQAARAEGGAIESSEAEPAKFRDPGASELKPTKTLEAEKEETEIYEAHKVKAIDAYEAETILFKALSEDHQSKACEREAAASQATNTADTGTTQLQATKPNWRNAIESQASEIGNIGETKPKVSEANEARASQTGETGTIDSCEAVATDPKTSDVREEEPAKESYQGPIKLEPTKAKDPRTTECLAKKTIEANKVKPEAAQAEASEARKTEIGEAETTEPKETREVELAMSSDPGSNELQDAKSNEASATVPQGNETGDSGKTELQAAQIEAGEAGKTEAGKDEPVKCNNPGASEPQLTQTGEAEEKETGVYETQKGGNVDIRESSSVFKAREAIAAEASESQDTEICEIGASQAGGTAATESKLLKLARVKQLD